MSVPGGVCAIALSIRKRIICATRSGSQVALIGARPTISSAPATTTYGGTITVQTPDAARIAAVSLIRLGSATHAFDMDQRFVPLVFTTSSGALNIQAPANANLAPPGYYMLFILDTNGIPSVAAILKVQ